VVQNILRDAGLTTDLDSTQRSGHQHRYALRTTLRLSQRRKDTCNPISKVLLRARLLLTGFLMHILELY